MRLRLPDPEVCRACQTRGRIVESRKARGWRRRRHVCPGCARRWSTWQSVINPAKIRLKATAPTPIVPSHEAQPTLPFLPHR